MLNTRHESWKGFDIAIAVLPVRHYGNDDAGGETYVGIVKIGRDGSTVADWHMPRFAARWHSAAEAHRDALDHAVHAIDSGRLGETLPLVALAA